MDDGWSTEVRDALIRGDEQALRRLFAARVSLVGDEQASHDWLEVASTLDASAQTG